MTVKYESEKVDSCVLVADVEGSSYHFNVKPQNIEPAIALIESTYFYLNKPCDRVYIGGFDLVSQGTNLKKDELIKRIAFTIRQNDRIHEIQSGK